jgi:hypothetical protein
MDKRLLVRRGLGRAKVAVGRKLRVRSYGMLRDGIDDEAFLRRGVEARLARNAPRRTVPENSMSGQLLCGASRAVNLATAAESANLSSWSGVPEWTDDRASLIARGRVRQRLMRAV